MATGRSCGSHREDDMLVRVGVRAAIWISNPLRDSVCLCARTKFQNSLLTCVRYNTSTKDIMLGGGELRPQPDWVRKLLMPDGISKCANSPSLICQRLWSQSAWDYRPALPRLQTFYITYKSPLTRALKPGWYIYFTATTSSPQTNEEHAYIFDHWPLRSATDSIYSLWACVDWTLALWSDWLLIPWCVFRLCSHSYRIYGCGSVHCTYHTHSHSFCLSLPCHPIFSVTETQPCNHVAVMFFSLFFSAPLQDEVVIKALDDVYLCICVTMHKWSC